MNKNYLRPNCGFYLNKRTQILILYSLADQREAKNLNLNKPVVVLTRLVFLLEIGYLTSSCRQTLPNLTQELF